MKLISKAADSREGKKEKTGKKNPDYPGNPHTQGKAVRSQALFLATSLKAT